MCEYRPWLTGTFAVSITLDNAQVYPPPDLQHFMKEELGPGSAPYRWYAQMMGEDLQCESAICAAIAYDTARKRWRRLLPEVQERERKRERTRVREEGAKNPYYVNRAGRF